MLSGMFDCLSPQRNLKKQISIVMGLISLIRAGLGLADPEAKKPSVSPEQPLPSRKPISHLPPPPAPLNPCKGQTAPQFTERNHHAAPAPAVAPSLPIVMRSFPDLPGTLGPLPLTKEAIASTVPPGMPGHFLIGSLHESGGVIPKRLGRSSYNLYAELEGSIGNASHFMAHVDSDAKEAFLGECTLYHNFDKHDDIKHPMRSLKEGWGCPKCGIFNPGP